MMQLKAFTLAELLIALAVLGVIAAFTIPKVLVIQKSQAYNSIVKETMGMLSSAYQAVQANGDDTTYMAATAIIPYFNYVKMSSRTVDDVFGPYTCTSNNCIILHNGASLNYFGGNAFCNGSSTGIPFNLDVDGQAGGGEAIHLWLYKDGSIKTYGTMKDNTVWGNTGSSTCTNIRSKDPSKDPAWLSWN